MKSIGTKEKRRGCCDNQQENTTHCSRKNWDYENDICDNFVLKYRIVELLFK